MAKLRRGKLGDKQIVRLPSGLDGRQLVRFSEKMFVSLCEGVEMAGAILWSELRKEMRKADISRQKAN